MDIYENVGGKAGIEAGGLVGALKHAWNLNLINFPKMAPGYYSFNAKLTVFWPSWGGKRRWTKKVL